MCHENYGPCFGLMQLGVKENFNATGNAFSFANRVYGFKDNEKGVFD